MGKKETFSHLWENINRSNSSSRKVLEFCQIVKEQRKEQKNI